MLDFIKHPVPYLVAAAGLASFVGYSKRTEVPEGALGISTDKKTVLSTPQIVVHQPGTEWWGQMRYPDFRVIRPGETTVVAQSLELTPGTWDKVVVAGQESLLVSLIPGLNKAVASGKTDHLVVDCRVKVVAPTDSDSLVQIYKSLHSTDFESALSHSIETAFHDKEGALSRRFLKPKLSDVEAAIATQIKDQFGLSEVVVQIAKISKITTTDQDREAVREGKRDKIGSAVEVLFEIPFIF